MKRTRVKSLSKKATTLVELIVSMALTAIFAGACVLLILPVENIYTHTTDLSRAHLLADTIVYSLRSECARSYITGEGDVWIGTTGNERLDSAESASGTEGPVLVFRKNSEYCETIFSNGAILDEANHEIETSDTFINEDGITDRAIFRLFAEGNSKELGSGYIHFGYYESTGGTDSPVVPNKYYDFTNPFAFPTYRDFTTNLTFHDIGYDTEGKPSWVLCKIEIVDGTNCVYSRDTILCFAAPAQ
ncbi:MAG: hypothetical protein K6E12_09980 [Saccharofermentans sp.]|nr:hypothetical protein [Saccharofermentans sp.]